MTTERQWLIGAAILLSSFFLMVIVLAIVLARLGREEEVARQEKIAARQLQPDTVINWYLLVYFLGLLFVITILPTPSAWFESFLGAQGLLVLRLAIVVLLLLIGQRKISPASNKKDSPRVEVAYTPTSAQTLLPSWLRNLVILVVLLVVLTNLWPSLSSSQAFQTWQQEWGKSWQSVSKAAASLTETPKVVPLKTDHIIAPTGGEWSDWVPAPTAAMGIKVYPTDVTKGGDIEIENPNGRKISIKKNELAYNKLSSLFELGFWDKKEIRFRSTGDKEVPMTIEWLP